ncbi:gamma-glutamyltranspeptidase [Rubrobacter taiwanensis]|jgi:gamma-glutamyltranspeptidase/glutathione hydrolase|uniref:Gamma-glutamyltranspeptidase n=1 Tax=Rubrobacter taiwanensis TaxID=185139 RepID=A0A4R1BI03_9ACTN|nr:gamma-glutamyltransferase [Rubrobacter taiwanensis]TCJ16768.1 gamma-glutamyltranspeptidase [Rubrobacter taiwanensis]
MDELGVRASFAVAAGTPYAARAAAEVYRAGGNAADAAVAAAAAVSVTEPLMSSIGGGGFATVRAPGGSCEVIDFYDCMPGKGLDPSAFGAGGKPETIRLKYGHGIDSTVGAASCAVPGALRGWELLQHRHGRLTLREALAPAARLAREGFRLCKTSGMWLEVAAELLKLTGETRKNFYNGDRPYLEGEFVRFPDLADTFDAVRELGADLFYRGELAQLISEYILARGGIITARDLAEYEAVVREPLTFRYRGRTVYTNGPPSAGGATLVQMLNVISAYDIPRLSQEEFVRILSGAMRLALHDRASAYVEADEIAEVAERLTSDEYARVQRQRIFGPAQTTHLSCMDAGGLAVSITQSMGYGSGITIPGTGIWMGNTLGEPELNPKGFHALKPGQRLVSSMSPTILITEEGDMVALGSPGASRIPTAILQVLINVFDRGMALKAAVEAPRFHAEGRLFAYEAGAPRLEPEGGIEYLAYEEPSMYFGGVNAVRRTPQGTFEAAADSRRSGGVDFG